MTPLTRKQKGDLAELKVACDLRRRGYEIAIPFGEEASTTWSLTVMDYWNESR